MTAACAALVGRRSGSSVIVMRGSPLYTGGLSCWCGFLKQGTRRAEVRGRRRGGRRRRSPARARQLFTYRARDLTFQARLCGRLRPLFVPTAHEAPHRNFTKIYSLQGHPIAPPPQPPPPPFLTYYLASALARVSISTTPTASQRRRPWKPS
jgi:hypothetical protein